MSNNNRGGGHQPNNHHNMSGDAGNTLQFNNSHGNLLDDTDDNEYLGGGNGNDYEY